MLDAFFILFGMILLFWGGEWLVRGSVATAEHLGVSKLLISTVVIGFGTSTPELFVSVEAALNHYPEIALGNVVGSNLSNLLLILGAAACCTVIPLGAFPVKRDALCGLLASLAFVLLALSGEIGRIAGCVMVAFMLAYLSLIIVHERDRALQNNLKATQSNISFKKALILTLIGLFILLLGAQSLIVGSVAVAQKFGISEATIGLSLVALGTSLPELVTVLVAAHKRHPEVIIGNILGSNLFNLLSIIGITAIIKPIPVAAQIAHFDSWILLGITLLVTGLCLFLSSLKRPLGIGLIVGYFTYIAWLYY